MKGILPIKIFLLFIIIFSCNYSASSQTESPILANATYTDVFLVDILNKIEEEHFVSFYYQSKWLPKTPLNISVENNQPLDDFLSRLLSPLDLRYFAYDDYSIIIMPVDIIDSESNASSFHLPVATTGKIPQYTLPFTILGDSLNRSPSGKAVLSGLIIDKNIDQVMEGVILGIPGTQLSTISGEGGKYSLELPVGKHEVHYTYLNYRTEIHYINIYSDANFDIELAPDAIELSEVVVEEQSAYARFNSTQIGVEEIKVSELQKLPNFLGGADVVKSLLNTPGINSVGEGASGFNVRGGNIDQNLVLQNGSILMNASHVLGFFSVFNPDLIQSVQLYKGHIPAQYGGRISSVLQVTNKQGDKEKYKGNVQLGAVYSSASIEGPIIKNKTTFNAGIRSSYSDWVLKLMQNPNVKNSSAFFYDMDAKITQWFNAYNTISLSAYTSYDKFRYVQDFGFDWKTQSVALEWRQKLNQLMFGKLSLSFSDYKSTRDELSPSINAYTFESGIKNYKAKYNIFVSLYKHTLNIGTSYINYQSSPQSIQPLNDGSVVQTEEIRQNEGREYAIYVNDEYNISKQLSISAGLRLAAYQALGPSLDKSNTGETDVFFKEGEITKTYSGVEPRLSLKYSISEKISTKLSYNKIRQFVHLISNSTSSAPSDIWQITTPLIKPQQSNSYSMGFFHLSKEASWESSIEFYYKDIDNLIDYKNLPQLVLNPLLEEEVLQGKGKNYGFEVSVRKNKGAWTGRLSYTFARSKIKLDGENEDEIINTGKWFSTNFDKPHAVNLSANYKVNKRHTFSVNFIYSTGRPITIPASNYFIGNVTLLDYAERNAYRIPDYHRLDISYTIENRIIRKKGSKGSWTFSLYNLYGRKNAYSIYFEKDKRLTPDAFKLSILGSVFPSVTYNLKLRDEQ